MSHHRPVGLNPYINIFGVHSNIENLFGKITGSKVGPNHRNVLNTSSWDEENEHFIQTKYKLINIQNIA